MSNLPIFEYNEIFTAPVRLLIKESHAIFSTIPRNSTDMTKNNVITISRRYRSIVHECVDNLTRDITDDHSDQIKTFRELEVIWNLCEILLLDVSQTGTLIIQLRNWIKMHFDDLGPDSKEIIRSIDNNDYQFTSNDVADTYWNLLLKLVIRGESKRAVQLLASHYDFEQNDQMQLVASMLESMPLSNQYIVHEFCNKWASWSSWCKRERETGQFEGNQHLLNIVRLLSQDITVYQELASYCEYWYQLMVAHLLYTDPCIKDTNLSDLCRLMITTFKKYREPTIRSSNIHDRDSGELDEIIIAAFEYDLVQVITLCCSYLDDNWWFVTHFVDLLHCSDQLKVHEIVESDKLRETFLQDYATTLFDDEFLWPIGVSYLNSCQKSGLHCLELLLSRIPLNIDDEHKAHKIISIAKKRGLTTLSKSVCILMAQAWLSKTLRLSESRCTDRVKHAKETDLPPTVHLSNALYWAIKSGDTLLITYVSDQYLLYYCRTGTFPDKSVFEGLRRSALNNERLAFLTKYYEFKQLMQDSEDDLSQAGHLLKALLASKIYPKFFCQELLDDANALLEVRSQLVFHPDTTLDLMRSIEEILKGLAVKEDMELSKNVIRNMARALITPINLEK